MDWKELLGKLRLVDINAEGKQVGAVNVSVENKTENKTYNFNFYNAEAAKAFAAGFKITSDFEERGKEEAERRLNNLGISPDLLSESTRAEIAGVTTASSLAQAINVGAGETLNITENVVVKLSPKP